MQYHSVRTTYSGFSDPFFALILKDIPNRVPTWFSPMIVISPNNIFEIIEFI